jgi:hypothetical protein
MKKRLSVMLLALLLLALSAATTAQAKSDQSCRDRNGDGRCDNAEKGTDKARSACSFSGINDNPDDPTGTAYQGQTQNYGQLVKKGDFGVFEGANPGFGCNPEKSGFPRPNEQGS